MGAASNDAILTTETCRAIQGKTKPTYSFPIGLKAGDRIPTTHAAIVLCKCPSPAGAPAELLLVSILGGGAGAQPGSLQAGMALVNIKLILTQATMLGLQCELSSLKGQLAMEQAENQLLKIDLARANNLAREGEGLRAKQDLTAGLHQKSQVSSLFEVALGSPQHSMTAHWDAGHALGDKDMGPAAVQVQGSPASASRLPAGGAGHGAMTALSGGQISAPSRDQQPTRAAREAYPAREVKLTLQSTAWARHSTESEAGAVTPRGSRIPKAPASLHTRTTATSQASWQVPGSSSPTAELSKAAGRAPAEVPKAGHTTANSSASRSIGAAAVTANPGRIASTRHSSLVRHTLQPAPFSPAPVGVLAPLVGVGMEPKEGPNAAKLDQQQFPHRVASSDVDLVRPLAGLSDESTSWLLAGDPLGAWQRTPSLVLR